MKFTVAGKTSESSPAATPDSKVFDQTRVESLRTDPSRSESGFMILQAFLMRTGLFLATGMYFEQGIVTQGSTDRSFVRSFTYCGGLVRPARTPSGVGRHEVA